MKKQQEAQEPKQKKQQSKNQHPNQQDKTESVQEEHQKNGEVQHDELTTCREERDAYKNQYLKALADYRNLENRMSQERAELTSIAQSQVMLRLIPFLDNLKRAEMFIQDSGLKMIKEEYVKTIEEIGLREVSLEGQVFDPRYAEVIEVVDGEQNDVIVEVVSGCYMFGDKVLRHGQVKVSKVA